MECALFEIRQLVTRCVIGCWVSVYARARAGRSLQCKDRYIPPEWEVIEDSKGAFASVTCIFRAVSPWGEVTRGFIAVARSLVRSGELFWISAVDRVSLIHCNKVIPTQDCWQERRGKMRLFVVFLLSTFVLVCKTAPSRSVFTNHWAVRLTGGSEEADKLASKYGFTNLGQVRFY